MNWNVIDRVVAWVVFAWALVLYTLTVAPTTSFWGSGEFIAIAHGLQVSHPPGAPFYMLVGRLFSMVLSPILGAFGVEASVAVAINLVSVLSSALTILLTHLIIVRLVREWQGPRAGWATGERFAALFGGAAGALAFAATDSFWFNAVEAEVYALSMFFTAIVVWLILKWREQAQLEEAAIAGGGQHPFGLSANRYLVLIAYLFGLAIGVHLLNLLAIFFIALIFFFTEIEKPGWDARQRWTGILLAGVVSSAVFLTIYPGIIQGIPELMDSFGLVLTFVLVVGLIVFGVYYTHTRHMQVANLVMVSLAVVVIGYSTYAVIFVRSAADPPIDENDPETTEAIVSYLKREQYGATPLLKGPTYDNRLGRVDFNDETFFPRRYSPEPMHQRVYAQYNSDMAFFWKYQLGHMYVRYFLWNFVGKASDEQDAPPITGLAFVDDRIPGADSYAYQTPSERESRNGYFALPLLLGLFGAAFHFQRDWRRAFSVLILFLVTGVGIILYLNQTPMQPRERDYSYVASFFAFSLWIGIGAAGVLQLAYESVRERMADAARNGLLAGLGALLLLAVPVWMTAENYFDHDRSGNYVAPEYAYNMLMSLDEHAIVFTNGDNDTFPLWYLQEVEGVRRDVRVVNLSLLNTPWYVNQLKNQASRESAPLPISLSDQQIRGLSVVRWEPQEIELPVDKRRLLQGSEMSIALGDSNQIQSPMRWRLEGRPYSEQFNILYAADLVALDILRTNAQQGWERPVYFAVTVSPDGQLNLQNYFQMEGQAFRVVPIEHNEAMGRVVPSITPERLKEFRFTGVADPDVYYDENIRRMVDNYRNVYGHVAQSLAGQGYDREAVALLDTLMQEVPFETIPGAEGSFLMLARAYQAADARERVVELMKRAEPLVLQRLQNAASSRDLDYAARYVQMIRFAYLDAGDFKAASDFSGRIADVLQDSSYRQSPEELRRLFENAGSGIPPASAP